MEKKEFAFKGTVVNGFAMLSLTLALLLCGIASAIYGFAQEDNNANGGLFVGLGVALIVCMICVMCGFVKIEPNEARVMVFFGQYKGTFTTVGFHWVNPFISTKRLSFRARNIDAAPIKVNDKTGNPVLIGMMLVWRLRDTYKAIFEIDSEAMATSVDENGKVNPVSNIMMAFDECPPGVFACSTTRRAKRRSRRQTTRAASRAKARKARSVTSAMPWPRRG